MQRQLIGQQLLQRTFPGQLPTIRRNVHNAVIPLDLTDLKDVQLLVESIQTFVKRKVPIRFGIVPTLATAASQDQARLVYHLLDTYGLGAVVAYLEAVSLQSWLSLTLLTILYRPCKVRKLQVLTRAISNLQYKVAVCVETAMNYRSKPCLTTLHC